MGNQTPSDQEYQEKFNKKYEFTDLVEDANFGKIKVYRKKQLNFDYVMVLQKYVPPNRIETLSQEIKRIHHAFLGPHQPMALRIFNFDILQDSWAECRIPVVRLYVQYFNFTLYDLIQRHKEYNGAFLYNQLVYIVYAVLNTYEFFKKMQQTHFMINSKAIYLSTEGCIRFSPIKADDFFQQNNAFCKAMIYETHERDLVNFERGKKYILNQIKRLVAQMMDLGYRGEDGKKSIQLLNEIRKSNSLEKIEKIIEHPKIDCLCLVKRELDGSLATNNLTLNTQKSLSPSEQYTKMSLKKHLKSFHGSDERHQ